MDLKELLVNVTKEMNIEINQEQINKFMLYKDLLIEWNEKFNLTAITNPEDIIIKHFADSLSVLSPIIIEGKKNIIDIGTGAGFPGIPIKIMNENIKVTLMDSTNKRISFLEEVISKLNLSNVTCVHGRAEEFALNRSYREKYDYCFSRAVANLRVLCELCLPYVKIDGKFIASKGLEIEKEVEEAKITIKKLGGHIEEIKTIKLPNSEIFHNLVVINKLSQTPTGYPRIMGKILKTSIK